MMRKKGISPILAAVLLIAFTVAIAGMVATWATTFTRERLADTSDEADCIGALDISNLAFSDKIVSAKIRNVGNRINLTNIKAILEYDDPTKNKEYLIKDYNVMDPLPPAATSFLIINTSSAAKPKKIEVLASNCAREPVGLSFR